MFTLKLHIAELTSPERAAELKKALEGHHGVARVDVNLQKRLIRVIGVEPIQSEWIDHVTAGWGKQVSMPSQDVACAVPSSRPTPIQLVGLFAVIIGLGYLLTKLGVLQPNVVIGGGISFGAVFLMGLVAASSSCIAVSGGLMLSTITTFSRARPVVLFVVGRLVSYTVLGGLIGLLGSALIPSPAILGIITIAAALYMMVMGLGMLQISPLWLRRMTPTVPKALTNKILGAEGQGGALKPFVLGAATFFLPCGFTQALQIYALTTGSFMTSALLLFGFALGTAPALLALGWASTSLKGKTGQWFYRLAGTLVIVLGVWNINNGLTIAGVGLPKFHLASAVGAGSLDSAIDPNVVIDGQTQVIKMSIQGFEPYYLPTDEFTVKADQPVRLEIYGQGNGCRAIFQIPKFGVRLALTDSVNVIEFTPTAGDAVFSCSMGMYRGTIHVINS